MAEISLNINGQSYDMECDDGQEGRVLALGDHVDAKLREIQEAGAASSDSHLLVLTALMLSDEIFDLKDQLRKGDVAPSSSSSSPPSNQNDAVVAQTIKSISQRIDSLAKRIEKA